MGKTRRFPALFSRYCQYDTLHSTLSRLSTFGAISLTYAAMGGCATDSDLPAASAGEDGSTSEGVVTAKGALIGGTVSTLRPEVGNLYTHAGCTATLVHPEFVLAAAHCNYGIPFVGEGGVFVPATGQIYDVENVWVPGPDGSTAVASGGRFNLDVMLVKLKSAIPWGTLTPATIADVLPNAGDSVSTFGYGPSSTNCTSGTGKRYLNWTFSASANNACPGDSGGPSMFGNAAANGAIWGVTSTAVEYANVAGIKEDIVEAMRIMQGGSNWVYGIDRVGGDLTSITGVTTPASCEVECIKNQLCASWVLAATTCYLKDALVTWVPAPKWTSSPTPSGIVSGRRPLVEVGWSRTGTTIGAMPAQRAETCAGYCGRNSACMAFNFDSTTCTFLSSVSALVASASSRSGRKSPNEANKDRAGGDFRWFSTSSAATCRTECSNEARCRSFAFVSGTSMCYLKESVPWARAAASGIVSGVKRQMELPGFYLEGTVLGSTFNVEPPVAETCRTECNKTANCVAYRYRRTLMGLEATCTLLSSVFDASSASRSEWSHTSGFAGTTFF